MNSIGTVETMETVEVGLSTFCPVLILSRDHKNKQGEGGGHSLRRGVFEHQEMAL